MMRPSLGAASAHTSPLSCPSGALLEENELVAGNYEVRGFLGRGGMAQVFEAKDLRLQRRVALKVADPEHGAGAAEHVRREGLALGALRHPSLVTVFAAGEHGRLPFLALERIYGLSLEAHLERRAQMGRALPVTEALDILIGLVEGLSVIHHAGIVHRDVKPGNVMLAPRGRTVLMDLGIFIADSERADGQLVGTPHYLSPEVITGGVEPGLSHLVDLYAIGIIAFEMLAGVPPYDAAELTAILDQHLEAPVPSLSDRRPDIPLRLAELVARLMEKDPRARPPHADDVLWQLVKLRRARETVRPLSVLIVDDEADARELLRSLVERSVPEADVRAVPDAEQALRHVLRATPDFLLLDLRLPGMNGLELYLYLAGLGVLARTDVVVISGDPDARHIEPLRQLGPNRVLTKGARLAHDLSNVLRTSALRRSASHG